MNIMTCTAGSWLPFADPSVEEEKAVTLLMTLVETAIERKEVMEPSEWEKSRSNLVRILRSQNHVVDSAVAHWKEWVAWRHKLEVDKITEEDMQYERSAGLAYWKGKDKLGRPCLVITGRMMDPPNRGGTIASFRKFMIRLAEEGCHNADAAEVETMSIIYDRRGLEYKHMDSVLHSMMRNTVDNLRTYYGSRLGVVYVVHANLLFWGAFHFVIMPFLRLINSRANMILLLSDEKALLPYIDEDQIHLLPLDATPGNHSTILSPSQFARQPHSDSDGQETKQSDASREISSVIPTDSIKR